MDHPNDPNISAGAPQPQETQITAARSLFEDGPPLPVSANTAAAPDLAKPKRSVWTRFVLPLVLFIAGIGALAWVVQFLPGRNRAGGPASNTAGPQEVIQFPQLQSVWGSEQETVPGYLAEMEVATAGDYDFPLYNSVQGEVELGLAGTSCAMCTKVEVAVFKDLAQDQAFRKLREQGVATAPASMGLEWVQVKLDHDMREGVKIPGGASGLVRVHWDDRKKSPEFLELGVELWSREVGKGREPAKQKLKVVAVLVQPAMFEVPMDRPIDLGALDPGREASTSFICFSPTRDIEVKSANDDPLLDVKVTRLTDAEVAALQKDPKDVKDPARPDPRLDKFKPRRYRTVRSAYKIEVVLHESRGGRQLDMGLYLRQTPLSIMDRSGKPISVVTPMLRANVRGVVTLSNLEDGNRIDFRQFRAKDGSTRSIKVLAPKGAVLSYAGCDPARLDLEVALKEKEHYGNKTVWDLTAAVKAGGEPGELPSNGVLILRCEMAAFPPALIRRLVHIPVVGTATRN